jgi:hypothetical protein
VLPAGQRLAAAGAWCGRQATASLPSCWLLLYYKQMSEKGISRNVELKYCISNRNRIPSLFQCVGMRASVARTDIILRYA